MVCDTTCAFFRRRHVDRASVGFRCYIGYGTGYGVAVCMSWIRKVLYVFASAGGAFRDFLGFRCGVCCLGCSFALRACFCALSISLSISLSLPPSFFLSLAPKWISCFFPYQYQTADSYRISRSPLFFDWVIAHDCYFYP